jgi:hypothetical protein
MVVQRRGNRDWCVRENHPTTCTRSCTRTCLRQRQYAALLSYSTATPYPADPRGSNRGCAGGCWVRDILHLPRLTSSLPPSRHHRAPSVCVGSGTKDMKPPSSVRALQKGDKTGERARDEQRLGVISHDRRGCRRRGPQQARKTLGG